MPSSPHVKAHSALQVLRSDYIREPEPRAAAATRVLLHSDPEHRR